MLGDPEVPERHIVLAEDGAQQLRDWQEQNPERVVKPTSQAYFERIGE